MCTIRNNLAIVHASIYVKSSNPLLWIHISQELYGGRVAGELLSCLSRLWTIFLQGSGFTCGIGDLLLDPKAELRRIELTAQAERKAMCASAEIVGIGTDDLEGADSSVSSSPCIAWA